MQYVEAHGTGTIARRSHRGAGARGSAGPRANSRESPVDRFGEDQRRSPGMRRRRGRVCQGRAGASTPRNSTAPAPEDLESPHQLARAADLGPHPRHAVAERPRAADRGRELVRLQRHECACPDRRSARRTPTVRWARAPIHLLCLSAKSEAALAQLARRYEQRLAIDPSVWRPIFAIRRIPVDRILPTG